MTACRGQLGALLLEAPVQLGVGERQRRLAGEGLQQVTGAVVDLARRAAPDEQSPHNSALAQHRNRNDRPPPGIAQQPHVLVVGLHRQVCHLQRTPLTGSAPDEGVVEADANAPQGSHLCGARPVRRADAELSELGVELEDGTAVGPRQRNSLRHDRGEHLIEVQGRADGLPDRAQRLQLVKPCRQRLLV